MPIVSNRHRIPESIDIGKDIRRVSVFIRGVVEEFRNGLKKRFYDSASLRIYGDYLLSEIVSRLGRDPFGIGQVPFTFQSEICCSWKGKGVKINYYEVSWV